MRKYLPNESCCGAVYDNAPADNPFLAALPEMLPRDEFLISIRIRRYPQRDLHPQLVVVRRWMDMPQFIP